MSNAAVRIDPTRVVLWGDELTELGSRRVEAPASGVAVGLSPGAKKKSYAYTDPNEDAVAVVVGEAAVLVVLADGHNGIASTRAAVAHMLDGLGGAPAPSSVSDTDLVDLFFEAGERARAAGRAAGQPQSRTTLIVALVGDDHVRWAAMGDSTLLVAKPTGQVRHLGERSSRFVGWPMTREQASERLKLGLEKIDGVAWVIAATDGLADFVPGLDHAMSELIATRPRAAVVVEELIDAAFAGGAGDNVAIAAVRAEPAQHVALAGARSASPLSRSRDARTRGCIIGGAVGDALGAAAEFLSIDQIRGRYGPDGVLEYEPAYGHRGAITDDTQMTIFTVEGLLRAWVRGASKGIMPDVVGVVDHAYGRWLRTQGERGVRFDDSVEDGWLFDVAELHHRRAPGNTCLSALRAASRGSTEAPLNDSKGCGGVMRMAPAGLGARALGEDAFELGCKLAAITHGHPSGYLAAGALAEIIAVLVLDDGLLDSALDRAERRLQEYGQHEETLGALRAARELAVSGIVPSPEAVARLGEGWVAEEALAISVYCGLVAEDFTHGVRLAVNHSGDSDSTGAITGNILGAMYGYGAIPIEWVHALDVHAAIETLCRDWNTLFVFSPPPDVDEDGVWLERYPPW